MSATKEIRTVYSTPDLTFITEEAKLQKTLSSHINTVQREASVLSLEPVHSSLDLLFEKTAAAPAILFDPPSGYLEGKFACFSSSVIPSIDLTLETIASLKEELTPSKEIEELLQTLSNIETIFSMIKIFLLRFHKG